MNVIPVSCLRDNYAYLLVDPSTKSAAVVDPSESAPVISRLEEEGLTLGEIWLTHHHWDHVGGVEELVDTLGAVPVRGSRYDHEKGRIPHQTDVHADGDSFEWGGEEVRILEIPGHTLGAIAYVVVGNVFSGDTLFLGGCGRVFEGTMAMMTESLDKLRRLPGDTRVYCGHEYTVKNLEFALTVDPDNVELARRHAAALRLREEGAPTVPGTLADELATNPFLRFDVDSVAKGRSPVDTFTALREAKDRY